MLTIKQITENTDAVVRGLEKKHFKNAKEAIEQVLALNNKRRSTQTLLDNNLAEVNTLSKSIGQLMKEGKKDEAETAKARVGQLKEANKTLQADMDQAAQDLQQLLYTIPNVPYDEVPEGATAEDNLVVKMGGMETELPKDALPHWELAKKYDIIDFDLGVKITGAGFPVYKGKGARLQRALINFFLDEARASGYTEIMPPTVVNAASGYGTGQLPDKRDEHLPRRHPRREAAPHQELRLHRVLPPRGRLLWQGRTRPEPPARVLESRAGAHRQARALQAKPPGNAGPRGRPAPKAGTALPHPASLRR